MQWLLIVFIVVAGVLNTVQSGSNATLNKALDAPVWSAAIVFAVALATSVVAALVTGQRAPAWSDFGQVPWWGWIGGVFGALYIVSMMKTADQLGAAVFVGVTVTAAVVTSLVLDHFGWLGFEEHRAGLGRISGGVLMVAGLALIAKG